MTEYLTNTTDDALLDKATSRELDFKLSLKDPNSKEEASMVIDSHLDPELHDFKHAATHLPTETLLQIFDIIVQDAIQDIILGRVSVSEHPTLPVASVCQRWRDIVIDSPYLWRYIPVYSRRYQIPPSGPRTDQPLPRPTKRIYCRAKTSNEIFLDLDTSMNEAVKERIKVPVPDAENIFNDLNPQTKLSFHFSSGIAVLAIPFERVKNYTFYNIHPIFSAPRAAHITSLVMHFRVSPSRARILTVIGDLENLNTFEIYTKDPPFRLYPTKHASCPPLKRIVGRLSIIPLFFSVGRSVSKTVQSLTVYADQPPDTTFLRSEIWTATVEFGGLANSIRHLGLAGGQSLLETSILLPILSGFNSVATLSLHGSFMSPVLNKLTENRSLLASIHQLKLHETDIEGSVITNFLNARQGITQLGAVPIRDVVFDHCNNVTREFCDRLSERVENLTIHC